MKNSLILMLCVALAGPAAAASDDWVERSNANAELLLDVLASFAPEGAAALGVDGLDEQISDLRPGLYERTRKANAEVRRKLEERLKKEQDPLVRQDLEILIKAVDDNQRTTRLQHENLLPYYNVTQNIFQGLRALIDPQVPAERYPAAVARLRKYAGLERGYEPVTELAKDRTAERFDIDGLVGPFRGEVEQDLERAETFITGMRELLANSGIDGWKKPYARLESQLNKYNKWVRTEILPRAREDFRLPPALYEDALRNWGVYDSPQDLIRAATQGYMDIRNEMEALAPIVAEKKDFEHSDYRDVIRRLKQERIPGNELLEFYYARLQDIEDFIRANDLITLPQRDAGIRIASAAETAAQPSAHLDIPRLIGNTGEYPEFVLPQLQKDDDGNWIGSDDNFAAGTWTLTAHEARPGHELQFSAMIENGVSIARALFAFNSANVEGWALYAEAIAKPYMPVEGQLISLQYRLARAARMFLDPMLNLGLISPQEAKRLLLEDVVLGESWAQNEIERYTYRIPGQATAYYYGYMNMQSLRTRTELALRDKFSARAFHDFVLAQGLLPPDLLEKAVMETFVPQQQELAASLR
ncbi:MAG: DUF885 domain-containing protein [Gammaproteobacteria bacterium]|nr:DUF885 domain-containing protein [Gammaproteobacteria bacterium]NNF62115.1 DUF885 domain-containing protein [Gammaproteobacteria bacterium]NNM20499.1 DUF885 domain-containing protein [Gammaproteobacteria bacterium]